MKTTLSSSRRTIVVFATALRTSGSLTIYNQFIKHLPRYIDNDRYYLFVDPTVSQPTIEGVTYIQDANHSWRHRIAWDFWGYKKWLKKNGIKPDVIVSFQNTNVKTDYKSIVYFHQSIPLSDVRWNPFKSSERLMFLYKHVYPLFVRYTVKKKDIVVVQIPYMKDAYVKKFNHPKENVRVLSPDVNITVPTDSANDDSSWNTPYFIYPAFFVDYKRHKTIVNAVAILKDRNPELTKTLKIKFTLDKVESKPLYDYVVSKGCADNFEFCGRLHYDELMKVLKKSNGLLFPSIIESFGLPLIEAAYMGIPVVAANMPYAHDVLGDYPGARFVDSDDYETWATEISNYTQKKQRFEPLVLSESSWGEFFKIVHAVALPNAVDINELHALGGKKQLLILLPERRRERRVAA